MRYNLPAIAVSALVCLLVSQAAAEAVTLTYCVRVVGDDIQEVRSVTITIDATHLDGSTLRPVVHRLIGLAVWKGAAREVFLETDAPCSGSGLDNGGVRIDMPLAEAEARVLSAPQPSPEQDAMFAKVAARAKVETLSDPQSHRSSGMAYPGPEYIPKPTPFVRVQVWFATNRNRIEQTNPLVGYGSVRTPLSFGWTVVTIPSDHRMGRLESASVLTRVWRAMRFMQAEDASQEITVESLDVLTRERWREEIRRRAVPLGKPGILVFVHGFNVGFADAAKRAAQLAYDLAFPGPVVFFSWPSRGQVLDYTADGDAAEWSIPHLSDVLADLADLADGAPIYIVAHSMGNRVLTRAFHALVTQNAAKSNAFKEIVLTAPDIDADIFRTQIAPKILGAGPRTTLYASDTDKALTTSRSLHGGYQRLGQAGASLVILPGMETVDATSITTDFLSHSYFGDSTTVMADLFHLIRKGLPPSARTALQPATSPAGQYWRFKP